MVNLVQELFERSADRFPDKIAIACGDDNISYKALDNYSNGLAHALIVLGVRRGMMIPVFIEKSINSFKAILGVLKADCAYVPLDTKTPGTRLISILERCEARFVIVDSKTEPQVREMLHQAGSSVIVVDLDKVVIGNTSRRRYANLSIDIAYVIFTSGSTGLPKGVMIGHFAIHDYINFCIGRYDITDKDIVAQHAPLYFDNSVLDIYCAFSAGATLQLVYDELNVVIPKLASWLRDRDISIFFVVPSVLATLLKSRRMKPDMLPAVRHVIFAGEVIQPDVIAQWMQLYPHARYTNMYGPTEITVDCTFYEVHKPPRVEDGSIPIGMARPNMETFVRLESGELSQELGSQGELLIRGLAVGYGYLRDEERTKAVFIQNPRHNLYHDPLYCTGDLVRIAADNNILFLGRLDHQIKLHGNRVELGEIEAALAALEFVGEAIVVFNNSANPDEQEIGALITKRVDDTEERFLQRVTGGLKNALPDYMIPTRFAVTTGDLPLTPNGKYDRKAALAAVFSAARGK
jgi:amino acid adenylation domain-containing protein